jgi:cytochrome c
VFRIAAGLIRGVLLALLSLLAIAQGPMSQREDIAPGEMAFSNACRTCHVTKEGDNRLGPNLHNIIGRKAGSLPDYPYSSALVGADFVWNQKTLDRFIANPDEIVPGNKMKPYGGIAPPGVRAAVVAYLQSLASRQ